MKARPIIPGQKPPVTRAHTKATRGDAVTPANSAGFARLTRQAKNARRRKGTGTFTNPAFTADDAAPGPGFASDGWLG